MIYMVQIIKGLGLTGSGIVGTLVVAGILLIMLNVSSFWGEVAIGGGVIIAVLLGFLGVLAVIGRVAHR